jgi:hypothetical protein
MGGPAEEIVDCAEGRAPSLPEAAWAAGALGAQPSEPARTKHVITLRMSSSFLQLQIGLAEG